MHISGIHLQNFRNYEEEEISFSKHCNFISGLNGQGKTNLLEAVHFACLGFSHRTRSPSELIKWGQDQFTLRIGGMEKEPDRERHQSVQVAGNGQKRIKIDEVESRRFSDLFGRFPVVLFCPEDIGIINGSPGIRRMFLDALLCQHSRQFMEELRKFQRILKQRNIFLKDPRLYPQELLDVLDEQLISSGCEVIKTRKAFIEEFSLYFRDFYEQISESGLSLEVKYECALDEAQEADPLEKTFRLQLARRRRSELEQRTTLVGPHRDNLLFLLAGKPARQFGSQGQKRLISISLKMAAAAVLDKKFGFSPVLLLDDIFSELDTEKRKRLGETLGKTSQLFLASHKAEDLMNLEGKTINIQEGRAVFK